MRLIERVWFGSSRVLSIGKWLLLPLTILFWLVSSFRKAAYQWGLFKSYNISATVIIVGNISVGGNGKTPLVIYLADWLLKQGYRPGVLSRGYGGKSNHYPVSVLSQHTADEVGDEPILMRQGITCPLVVDPNRPRGAQFLVEQHDCNVIICDDGLQHYALQRDIEIVVVDGERLFGNGWLLPMGPLRERPVRLLDVDFVVSNGNSGIANSHVMTLCPSDVVNLLDTKQSVPLADFAAPFTAVAGIGHPQRFFDLLKQRGAPPTQTLSFVDHHPFSEQDLPSGRVLMTEKDAVKCQRFAHADWWYLPVTATLSNEFEDKFNSKLKQVAKGNSIHGV